MNTDPIADMFTRIRNANAKQLEKVDIPASKIKTEIARVLKEEGYIANFKNIEDYKQGILRVYLKYTVDGARVLQGIKRVSHSSLRIYRGYRQISRVVNGLGIAVISTPQGIMTDKSARTNRLGGEVLGYVW